MKRIEWLFGDWTWKVWAMWIAVHALFWFVALYYWHWWIWSLVIGLIAGTLLAQCLVWLVESQAERIR